jgi:putative membrane protein
MKAMRMWWLTFLLVVTFYNPYIALAHSGEPLAPHDLWAAWNTELSILLPLTLSGMIYFWGVQKVWQRAGVGHGLSVHRFGAFLGAILALFVALISPLDAMSSVLFSAHMVQHLLLILVAAPLLILSEFPWVALWVLPRHWVQGLGRRWKRASIMQRLWHVLTKPVSAGLIFALTIWLWHAPTLYQAALQDEAIHAIEHIEFLLSALLFWWIILDVSRPKRSRYMIAMVLLFTTAMHSGILGALMTFTEQPWYSFYSDTVGLWGLTPLQDQQLAGVIMWVPGGIVFTLFSILYFGALLRALEQHGTL